MMSAVCVRMAYSYGHRLLRLKHSTEVEGLFRVLRCIHREKGLFTSRSGSGFSFRGPFMRTSE